MSVRLLSRTGKKMSRVVNSECGVQLYPADRREYRVVLDFDVVRICIRVEIATRELGDVGA